MADNSAYITAPKIVIAPPIIQTTPNNDVQPTSAIIDAGTRNIPDPIILLITIATDSFNPKSCLYLVITKYANI